MNPSNKIIIVGGGVAGASLAIRLAQKGLKITLIEKDKFPRHKLCGEFVSPECLTHFEELEIKDSINKIEGDAIYETSFFAKNGKKVSVPSEWFFNGKQGAVGISRFEMDFCLLKKAKELGVNVLEQTRCIGLEVLDEKIKNLTIKNEAGETRKIRGDLIVDATGRANILSRLVDKQKGKIRRKSQTKYVGFKTHLDKVKIKKGVCEIYFFRGGYGGLSYVENGIANHCFLIDSKIVKEFKGDADKILQNVIFKNSRASEMLKDSQKKIEWIAVSVEKFGKKPIQKVQNLVSIGDASAFIDPFTGSGMLMALESSDILANTIKEHSDIFKIKKQYEKTHRKITRRRLFVCSLMRNLSFSPIFVNFVISTVGLSKTFLYLFTLMTRPQKNSQI